MNTPPPPPEAAKDTPTLYDRMVAECRRRGYDPDLMLGLVQALPKVEFVKPPHGYPHPVFRGKISGKTHMWHPDDEVK